MIAQHFVEQFHQDGYTVAPGLFTPSEVEGYLEHFMELRTAERNPDRPKVTEAKDPLALYPRIMHPHRIDRSIRDWLLDPRLDAWLTALLGASPYAVQTMFYFKPAGARGQALHQDQFYLRVQPGTCCAAWLALDPCDEENGCIQVVPGTHALPVLCTVDSDSKESFVNDTVPLPEGMSPVPVLMNPGDVLFFNGQLIHGSYPNRSQNRFRRSLIGHYIVAEAQKVADWYNPIMRMDGSELRLEDSGMGGMCGVWVDENGVPVVKMDGMDMRTRATIHG